MPKTSELTPAASMLSTERVVATTAAGATVSVLASGMPVSTAQTAAIDSAVSTHAALTTAHGAVSTATASRMVIRDASAAAAFGGIDLDTATIASAFKVGRMRWNDIEKCAEVDVDTDVTVQIGQELTIRARNATGSTVANGTPVYINGATGNRPTIAKADADALGTAQTLIGLVTDTAGIANNADGFVTVFGLVRDLDTSAYTEGATVYLSAGTAGTLTATKPSTIGQFVTRVGFVTRSHATQGVILVAPHYHGSVTGDAVMNAVSQEAARTAISAAAADLSNTEAQATVLPVKVAAGLRSTYYDLALARDDVLAYWKLGEASGSVIDSSPSALTGTLVGSVTRESASLSAYPSDYAATFSGAGAFNLGNVLNFDRTDKWTVEFLITPLVVANGSNYAVISKLRSSAPFTGWEVNLEGTSTTTARIGVYVGNSFPSGCILVKSAELLSVGTTYHVAVSCEPSGRGFSLAAATLQLPNIRIWIDGREQPLSGVDEVNAYGTVASTLVHSGNCYIGSQSNDSRRLNAVLDELAVYRGVVEYSYIKQRALLAVNQSALALARSVEAPPRNLILDFDINTDCDDMGDLHEALALRACGKLNLVGIITSTKSNSAAPAAQAILDYWSVSSSSVPIGAYQGSLGQGSDASVSGGVRDQFRPGDTRANYSDDLTVYRTILAAAEDNSVSIVSTGFAISLKRLMDSPADGISIYTGAQLIARKVAVLVLVGNVYPYNATASVEYNAASDPASWEQVIETWPTPLVFSGGELGEFVKTAPPINFNDRYLNPTRFAYYSFVTDNSRQSWGQLGMYWIAQPERFALSRAFTQTVNASTGQASVPNYTDAGTRYFLRLADKSTTIVQRELNALLFPVSYPNQTPLRITASTASVTLNPKQSGQLFNNIGATAIVPFVLPAAVAGLNFPFIVLDADGIRITAASGDTIRVGASVSAAAGKIESTTIGDYVHLVAMDDTQWVASPATGTWTAT